MPFHGSLKTNCDWRFRRIPSAALFSYTSSLSCHHLFKDITLLLVYAILANDELKSTDALYVDFMPALEPEMMDDSGKLGYHSFLNPWLCYISTLPCHLRPQFHFILPTAVIFTGIDCNIYIRLFSISLHFLSCHQFTLLYSPVRSIQSPPCAIKWLKDTRHAGAYITDMP
jgi:hypothetical protein